MQICMQICWTARRWCGQLSHDFEGKSKGDKVRGEDEARRPLQEKGGGGLHQARRAWAWVCADQAEIAETGRGGRRPGGLCFFRFKGEVGRFGVSEVNRARLARRVAVAEEKQLAGDLVKELEAHTETAADVNALCETYGLRREELGRLTGFSLRALADWAAGKVPSQPAHRRLHEVRRLLDALADVVKIDAITPWLHQKSQAFDNLTPLQVIETGEIDRLWAMVHERLAGAPS